MTKTLLAQAQGLLTTGEVAKALGLSPPQLRRRIKMGILPQPDRGQGCSNWLYSPRWLRAAKKRLGLKGD